MIWCFFDRDDNTNIMLSKAKQMALKEGYQIAFSNPSFEIWFLLHFNNQTTVAELVEYLNSKQWGLEDSGGNNDKTRTDDYG